MSHDVAAALADLRARVDAAATAAGRDPGSVRVVAVSKSVPPARIAAAVAAGQVDLGENRAQEMLGHASALGDVAVRWHFVGRLQRNKVRTVAPLVHLWHSVDRPDLVAELARRAPGAALLVQVNVAGEVAKAGCSPEEVAGLVSAAVDAGLVVRGLMTVPPAAGDPRRWFAALRELAARLGLAELSMGMSGDLEAAIAEGATIVRVGRAIFGPRPDPGGLRR